MLKKILIIISFIVPFLNSNTFAIQEYSNTRNSKNFIPIKLKYFKDTSISYFDRSNYLILGAGMDFRNHQFSFLNTTMNLIGDLNLFYNWLKYNPSNKNFTNWLYYPTINQSNITIFANTRYGSYNYYKSIKSTSLNSSNVTSFNFAIPYKKINFSFEYLKCIGINREGPLDIVPVFLKNMEYKPLHVGMEYYLNRVNISPLYTPLKRAFGLSLYGGYSSLMIKDDGEDFLPALRFIGNSKSADSVEAVQGVFMNEFNSTGFCFGSRIVFTMPLHKIANKINPKVLYLKGFCRFLYNFQNFEYHSHQQILDNVQFELSRKGFGMVSNVQLNSSIVYDCNRFLFGVGASYYTISYGKNNTALLETLKNNITDTKINYNAFIAYRIDFTSGYALINTKFRRLMKFND